MLPSPPPGRLARLADVVFRRRRVVLAAWVVALVAAFGAAGPRRRLVGRLLHAGLGVARRGRPARRPLPAAQPRDRRRRLAGAGRRARARPRASGSTASWPAPRGLEGIGGGAGAARRDSRRDGTIGVLRDPADRAARARSRSHRRGADRRSPTRRAGDGLRVELGGQLIANAQQGAISSEAVGLAIAALVLLITFGSLVAAGLPLATALFGLGISSALVGLLAAVIDVPDWAPALASMLGIGVGIDYALLIVTRYRAALAAGRDAARGGRRGRGDRRAARC